MVDDHAPSSPATEDTRYQGRQSAHKYKSPDGHCVHPQKPDDEFCHVKARSSGGLCHRPPGWGTDHFGAGPCKQHLGKTQTISKRAHEVLALRRARKELDQVNSNADPIDNPLEELKRLAGEALRWKNIMAAHVADLHTLRYSILDDEGRHEQIRGEVVLYERSMTEVGRLLVAIGRLNIDERLVLIEERKAELVVKAIEAGLRAAGVPKERWEDARAAAGAQLRAIA